MRTYRLVTWILISILLITCGHKTAMMTIPDKGINDSISIWLKAGTYTADVINGVKNDSRITELSNKMLLSAQKDKDWFLNYVKAVPAGEPLPYSDRLGLTKAEYNELLLLFKKMELKATSTEKFKIINDDNVIKFECDSTLKGLKFLTIDLNDQSVYLSANSNRLVIPYKKSLDVICDSNALKTKWHGFKWEYQDAKDEDLLKASSYKDISFTNCTLTLGRLEKNNKIYLSLKIVVIQKGVKVADNELPIIF